MLGQPVLQGGWKQKRLIVATNSKAFVHQPILKNLLRDRNNYGAFLTSISDTLPNYPGIARGITSSVLQLPRNYLVLQLQNAILVRRWLLHMVDDENLKGGLYAS